MAEVHLVIGVAVMALSLSAGVWGATVWLTGRPSVWFWYVLRAAQLAIVVQVLLGGTLLALGHEADRGVHYMYGIGALLVSLGAEAMRSGAAVRELPEDVDFESLDVAQQRAIALRIVRRETGIMTIAAFLIVAFAVRAATTSGHLF